jgi:phospholipid/cholesterol/gamma-HCH transport system substrate-binding protein
MQLGERNPGVIGAVAVGLAAVATVAALTIQRTHLVGGYEVVAEFADADGLREGDTVMISGVRAGEVQSLEIAGDHVEAELRIEGAELASDARARIVVETLVGKRAVQLDAGSDFADPLDDGDRIPLERTTQPTDVPDLGDASEKLLSNVDARELNRFVVALDEVVRGQREEVAALVDGGTDLARTVNDQEQQIRELLQRLRGLGETLNSRDEELVGIIDDVDEALGRLNERRDDLRALVRETRATTAEAADLVADKRGEIDAILTDLHDITDVLQRHQRDLAEGLAYSGDAILGFASVPQAQGQIQSWGHVFTQSLGPAGADVLVGCGGVLDQQLDQLLGPDPRSCAEQEGQSQPDRLEEGQPVVPPVGPEQPDDATGGAGGGAADGGIERLFRRAAAGADTGGGR